MAVKNNFKVYGQIPQSNTDIFPTDTTLNPNQNYVDLFREGIHPGEVARSQDVMTPLRELTIFSVAFFNWLGQQGLSEEGETAISEFKDAELGADATETQNNLNAALTNIYNALTQGITNKINSKEPTISSKPSLLSFLKWNGTQWVWDSNSYQTVTDVLTAINNFFNNVANEGLLYKQSNSQVVKTTNKKFVYFDPSSSESSDSSGNKILNLFAFEYTE